MRISMPCMFGHIWFSILSYSDGFQIDRSLIIQTNIETKIE